MDAKALYMTKPWLKFYPEGVPAEVKIPDGSIPEMFDRVSDKYTNKTALFFYGKKINYQMLRDHADRFATALVNLGITKGDRVALFLLNCPQFVIAYLGILKAGAIVTPISPVYTSQEVKHQIQDSGAQTIICQNILYNNVKKTGVEFKNVILTDIGEYLPAARKILGKSILGKVHREMHVPNPKLMKEDNFHQFQALIQKYQPRPPQIKIEPKNDIASLPYTGGTTGLPKGAILTHYNLIACHAQSMAFWNIFKEGHETIITFLPFYHIYGQVVLMLNALIKGFTSVLLTTPDMDDILSSIEDYQATIFYGVPTVFEYLKEYGKTNRVNWKRLKFIGCGADFLHSSSYMDWEKRTGTSISPGYGMTESCAVSHINPMQRTKMDSFGVPIPNLKAAIINPEGTDFLPPKEVGELIISGPNIMEGYWNRPEETSKAIIEIDGERWLRTGDLVSMDEEGYFYFFDRKRDLIKHKGYSVFAKEVEEVLYGHPQIKAAGVVGVPDPKTGQIVKAYVVLNAEARSKISEEEIIKYCQENLAHYKVPQIIEFRGELPKTDAGKVSRRELREELEES